MTFDDFGKRPPTHGTDPLWMLCHILDKDVRVGSPYEMVFDTATKREVKVYSYQFNCLERLSCGELCYHVHQDLSVTRRDGLKLESLMPECPACDGLGTIDRWAKLDLDTAKFMYVCNRQNCVNADPKRPFSRTYPLTNLPPLEKIFVLKRPH